MKKLLIIVITIFSPFWIFARQGLAETHLLNEVYNPWVDDRTFRDDPLRNIEGSPFIMDAFQPAFFSSFNKIFLVRYDAFQEKMQLKMPGDTIINLTPQVDYEENQNNKIIHFLPNLDYQITIEGTNKTYVPITYPDRKRNLKSFGVLLWQNKNGIQLIKREKKVVDARYSLKLTKVIEKYYLIDTKKELIQLLPEKKSELLNFFSENNTQELAKKEKLNPRKEEDLIKLFKIQFTN